MGKGRNQKRLFNVLSRVGVGNGEGSTNLTCLLDIFRGKKRLGIGELLNFI